MPARHDGSRGRAPRRRDSQGSKQHLQQKRKRVNVDIEALHSGLDRLDPKLPVKTFSDLPLSEPTRAGLNSAHFATLTDIQQRAIPHALKGHDILGAAKTGSGKTLAFLIPVLENLYRANHVGADAGLGAMIISPTRELAIQIFDVLYKIGRKGHLFAAGLVIGGKSLQEERDALVRMNILVCTPGRILQHLSQTAGFAFNVDALRMLVLDEADRILDMGFQRDVDAIIEYLPQDRQTLLFSATQTKRVSDLARLSLRDPEYISVHEAATTATPQTLQQNYVLSPLPEKLDTLYSFIQSSKKSKMLVFLSSGKQVRFVYEAFRHLQPGIPLLHLHGRQKQTARHDITQRFATAKTACLFATDVVARGLDFPAVDWVVQVDCPEDSDTYIHRVGRTARYEREGRAVLFLDPSEEEGMLSRLTAKKIPIEKINVKQKKKQSIRSQLQNMCFKDPQLKYLGQKAFISYVKSVQLQKDKDVFKLEELALEDFAASLGLPGAPRIKYIGTAQNEEEQRRLKNAPRRGMSPSDQSEDGEAQSSDNRQRPAGQTDVRTKYDRMFQRTNQDVLSSHYSKLVKDVDEDDAEGQLNGDALDDSGDENAGFLAVKRRLQVSDDTDRPQALAAQRVVHIEGALEPVIVDSKRREKLLTSKKKLAKLKGKGTKTVFDEEGTPHAMYEFDDEDKFRAQGKPEEQREQFAEKERARILEVDAVDKAEAKRKKKEKIRKRRERERAEAAGEILPAGQPGTNAAFEDFVEDAAGLSDDEEVPQLAPVKRAPKWFEQDEDGSPDVPSDEPNKRRKGKKAKVSHVDAQPETLEDLERIAEGLLF